ncbi:acyltransferase domain-containing protein, partial [Streptomyces sp. NPDC087850]|uniref:acyltransferase domain-containing protein n=1 Tax=Streptomyces sp. NPDC087850 TaxID=3365809 RepID=UPI0037F63710
PWPETGRPRRAGVSSFGISGTNAHVILEQAPPAPETPLADGPDPVPVPLVLTAATEDALRAQAQRLRTRLAGSPPATALGALGHALAATRSALPHRAAVIAADRDAALAGLAALSAGDRTPTAFGALAAPGRTAFLFTGQGSQRPRMGLELYAAQPVFRQALDGIAGHLDAHLAHPLLKVVADEPALLDRTEYAQPALFALEVALFRLLEHWGIVPDELLGHSVGELAAAHVAGVLSLPDACALVAARGRLMQALPETGAMAVIEATGEEILPALAGRGHEVALAAVNGPASVVISGDTDAVRGIARDWSARGRRTRNLRVSHAFHSPLMGPMLDAFREVVAGLTLQAPLTPLVSNVTGEPVTVDRVTSADYWVDHVRRTVRYADGIGWLAGHGVTTFLELGPDAALSAPTIEAAAPADASGPAPAEGCADAVVLPALRAGRPEVHTLTTALAGLHVRGVPVRWDGYFAGTGAHRVDLPTYAFQRRRYWPKGAQGQPAELRAAGLGAAHHPLLSAAVSLADSEGALLTGRLSLRTHPWLADHTVRGTTLLPGTAFLELAIRAGDEVGCDRVEELTLAAPLVLPEQGGIQVQLWIGNPDGSGRRTVNVYARPEDGDDTPWTRHATGVLTTAETPHGHTGSATAEWPPPGAEPVTIDGLYDRLAEDGFAYGPVFRGLRAVWRRDGEVYAEVALPGTDEAEADAFGLHPALLDAALHATSFVPLGEEARGGLPFSWEGVSLYATGASALRVRLSPVEGGAVSIAVADTAGGLVASVDSLVLRAVTAERFGGAGVGRDALFGLDWVPVRAGVSGSVVVVGPDPFGLGVPVC